MLHLSITMEKGDFPYHVRYPAKMAFIEFKVKLEMVVGIYAQDMKLELHSPNDKFCSELVGDDRTLEEMGVTDNSIVHVRDISQNSSSLIPQDSNTSSVEHYIIPDEKYSARKDTARKWKQEFLAARSSSSSSPSCSDHIVNSMQVGKRCVIRTSGQKPRFATLAYIGPTHFGEKQEAIRPNIWVGVIYEKPEGKNDGSLDGKRYFTCKPNFGGFVLPTSVEVLEEDGHFVNDSENQKDNEQIEEI
ncbi:hypothetical protein ACQ4LE_005484 [Meloidogyne hapla]